MLLVRLKRCRDATTTKDGVAYNSCVARSVGHLLIIRDHLQGDGHEVSGLKPLAAHATAAAPTAVH